MKKIIILLLISSFFIGCGGAGVYFSESEQPVWASELNSRVKEPTNNQITLQTRDNQQTRVDKRLDRQIPNRTVTDVVPLPEVSTPPPVQDLKQRLTRHKVDKNQDLKGLLDRGPHTVQSTQPLTPPSWLSDLKNRLNRTQVRKGQNPLTLISSNSIDLVGYKGNKRAGMKEVDLVFIVDTSPSMYEFLKQVHIRFQNFIKILSSHLNWRTMFTNADHGDNFFLYLDMYALNGKPLPLEYNETMLKDTYLTPDMPYYESIFISTLGLHGWDEEEEDDFDGYSYAQGSPGSGGDNEQPMKSVQSAFKKNTKLFRPTADKVAIIITDSDEGVKNTSDQRVSSRQVIETVQGIYPDRKFITYAISVMPNDTACQQEQGGGWFEPNENLYSHLVTELVKDTGGTNFSICDKDFTDLAKKIVEDLK